MIIMFDYFVQLNNIWMVEDSQSLEFCKKVVFISNAIFM